MLLGRGAPLLGPRSGHRLDAAYSRRNAALGHDLEQPQISAARHVGTATQLNGEIADAEYSHPGAVFLAEQRHGARGARLLQGHDAGLHRQVGADAGVDQLLNRGQLRLVQRFEVGEVEPQPLRLHQRPLLGHMLAQHLAQRGMQQVGRGVVAGDVAAPLGIHPRFQPVAQLQGAGGDAAEMEIHAATLTAGIGYLEAGIRRTQLPAVSHLPAGLAIEGGGIQHHRSLFPLLQGVHRVAVPVQRHHAGALLQALVAGEFALRLDLQTLSEGGIELAGGPGPFALRRHLPLEPLHVQPHAPFTGDVGGQIHREAVGVVEAEYRLAR